MRVNITNIGKTNHSTYMYITGLLGLFISHATVPLHCIYMYYTIIIICLYNVIGLAVLENYHQLHCNGEIIFLSYKSIQSEESHVYVPGQEPPPSRGQ